MRIGFGLRCLFLALLLPGTALADASSIFPAFAPIQFEPDFRGGAPSNQISVEYVFLRELAEGGINIPIGWNVSYARNLNRSLGIVGEVGTSYKSEGGISVALWDFMGGVRLSSRNNSAVTPYFEALGGVAVLGVSDGVTIVTFTGPSIQFGGGVDIYINRRLAIRGGVDYRAIFSDGDTTNLFRIRAGVVFGFGGRSGDRVVAPPLPLPEMQELPPPLAQVEEPAPIEPPPPPPAAAPAPPPPPPVLSDYERGQSFLRDGNFELAAVAFTVHLRQEDQNQFTAAIGLFCDRNNVAAHVVDSGYAPELFLLSVPRVGQSCFGIYWGLFGSRAEAQRGIETMPSGIRTSGPVVMPLSRVVR